MSTMASNINPTFNLLGIPISNGKDKKLLGASHTDVRLFTYLCIR